VATSLVVGESVPKKIGLLDIRGTNFRLRPIPLTQVRTFAMGEVSLAEYQSLNPDDPKVEASPRKFWCDSRWNMQAFLLSTITGLGLALWVKSPIR